MNKNIIDRQLPVTFCISNLRRSSRIYFVSRLVMNCYRTSFWIFSRIYLMRTQISICYFLLHLSSEGENEIKFRAVLSTKFPFSVSCKHMEQARFIFGLFLIRHKPFWNVFCSSQNS